MRCTAPVDTAPVCTAPVTRRHNPSQSGHGLGILACSDAIHAQHSSIGDLGPGRRTDPGIGFSRSRATSPATVGTGRERRELLPDRLRQTGAPGQRARFSTAMVALGDPRLPDPFDIDCASLGQRTFGKGRWADDRNWEFDFDQDLPAGIACRFVARPMLKSAAGARPYRQAALLFQYRRPRDNRLAAL